MAASAHHPVINDMRNVPMPDHLASNSTPARLYIECHTWVLPDFVMAYYYGRDLTSLDQQMVINKAKASSQNALRSDTKEMIRRNRKLMPNVGFCGIETVRTNRQALTGSAHLQIPLPALQLPTWISESATQRVMVYTLYSSPFTL